MRINDAAKASATDQPWWAPLSETLFSLRNYSEFKGYPDRHRVHWQLAKKLLGLPFQDIHFLLVNTVEEAYEPVSRVLACHDINIGWHQSHTAPLLRLVANNSLSGPSTTICIVANRAEQRDIENWLSCYLPNKTPKYLLLYDIAGLNDSEVCADLTEVKIVVIDDRVSGQQPEAILQVCLQHPSMWIVVHLPPNLGFDAAWNDCLYSAPNLVLILELPSTLKTGGESPPAVLMAHPEVIYQVQAHSYVVWYNMDYLHTHMLLSALQDLPENRIQVETQLSRLLESEAERVIRGRIRMDFNETRTQPTTSVFDGVRQRLLQTNYLAVLHEAKRVVSSDQKVPTESILLSSGANHGLKRAIMGILRLGQSAVLPDITYIAHVKAVIAAEADPIYVPVVRAQTDDPLSLTWDIDGILSAAKHYKPQLVCISNPSNPLGEVMDADCFDHFARELRRCSKDTVLLVDVCFHHYGAATGFEMPEYDRYLTTNRILVIGSLSKEDGYAGARAGFLFGSRDEVEVVRSTFPQSHPISLLGALTLSASRHASMATFRIQTVIALIRESIRIQGTVKLLEDRLKIGMRVRPCAASFMLLYLPTIREDHVVKWFRAHANIDLAYVKRFDYGISESFNDPYFHVSGQSEGHLLRISPGTPPENDLFLGELERFLSQNQNMDLGTTPSYVL